MANQFNPMDLLGSLMQKGMTGSSASRIEHSLGEKGMGGQGGILGQILGGLSGAGGQDAAGSGGPLGSLGKMAGALLGGGQGGKSLTAGGLGALAGALMGGGSKSMKGAMGGGALALLGSLALQAFRKAGKSPQTDDVDATTQLMAGLRAPETEQEQQQVQDIALLTLKAMLNAAKADGQIDDDELQRIVGELKEGGVTSEEEQFVKEEMRKPIDLDGISQAATNPQVAAQLYAASLLAIELDTEAERRYMQQLADTMRLDSEVVRQLHSAVGVS